MRSTGSQGDPQMFMPHPVRTVLVVEDREAVRRVIVQFLLRDGIAALQAGNTADALAMIRERQGAIDLAILDMVLPGGSGLDLASELGREYPSLRILYMSGFVDSVAMQGMVLRSPEFVLLKPFSEEVLLARVHKLLELPGKIEPASAGPHRGPSATRSVA